MSKMRGHCLNGRVQMLSAAGTATRRWTGISLVCVRVMYQAIRLCLIATLIFAFALVSCDNGTTSDGGGGTSYNIGDTGPGGGIIFYINADDELDWACLEAAPADVADTSWASDVGWTDAEYSYIGAGKNDTALILAEFPGDTAANNAAKACVEYSNNDKTDWFLPSYYELMEMYNALVKNKAEHGFQGGCYWSSTQEDSVNGRIINFSNGSFSVTSVISSSHVRPIRAIMGDTAARPFASLQAGTYEGLRSITLTSLTEGANIYYTLNGSAPGSSSTKYSGPITISASSTLKAIAIKDGMKPSKIMSETYTIIASGGEELWYDGCYLPEGTVGTFYSENLAHADGAPDISYALAPGSTPPAGLTLSPDGILSGTPISPVLESVFCVTASAEGFDSVTAEFFITIYPVSVLPGTFKILLDKLSNGPINPLDLVSVGLFGKDITTVTELAGYQGWMWDSLIMGLIFINQTQKRYDALKAAVDALVGGNIIDFKNEDETITVLWAYSGGAELYACYLVYYQKETEDNGINYPAGTVIIGFFRP